MLCTESINSNAQYMNGMTPFHLDLHSGKIGANTSTVFRYSRAREMSVKCVKIHRRLGFQNMEI